MICFSRIGKFGRLGNQLFQIAATIGCAVENNTDAKFPQWDYSDFFKNKIDQSLNPGDIISSYRENSFNYSRIPYNRNMDLVGYFQSDKYFNHCEDLIRNYFDFEDSLDDGSLDQDSETCSVHIRRVD